MPEINHPAGEALEGVSVLLLTCGARVVRKTSNNTLLLVILQRFWDTSGIQEGGECSVGVTSHWGENRGEGKVSV